RGGVRAAPQAARRRTAVPYARLSVGAALLHRGHAGRGDGDRVGADSRRQFRPDLRTGHCGRRIPRSLPLETMEEELMRKAVQTDKAPKPVGPYSQAIIEGDFIFVAGQGPIDPRTGTRETGNVRAETTRVFENLKGILEAAGSSLE